MELVLLRFFFFRVSLSRIIEQVKCFESDNFYESYICLKEMDRSSFFLFLKSIKYTCLYIEM